MIFRYNFAFKAKRRMVFFDAAAAAAAATNITLNVFILDRCSRYWYRWSNGTSPNWGWNKSFLPGTCGWGESWNNLSCTNYEYISVLPCCLTFMLNLCHQPTFSFSSIETEKIHTEKNNLKVYFRLTCLAFSLTAVLF